MIRPATVADARAIAELEVRAWRWAYVDIVAEQEMITVEEREAHWRFGRRSRGRVGRRGRWAGGRRGGGWPGRRRTARSAACRGLDVEPAAQGAGVGAALYEHAVAQLRGAGFGEAVVWLFEANGHARAFYERRGWSADGPTGTAAEAPELRYRQTLAP